VSELPERQEVAARVRRFKIEGYEIDDLVQEYYLALLTDEDPIRHLRRLQRRLTRRKVKVDPKPAYYESEEDRLASDNEERRSRGNIDCLVLMTAARAECAGTRDAETLELLASGSSYRELCQDWNCTKSGAKKRVLRFRKRLFPKLYEEELIETTGP
jgi:hypothetical protein